MTALSLETVSQPRSSIAFHARLVANEASKGLHLMWRRRSMVAVGALMNALTYLGINLFIGGGHLVKPLMVLTLPALLAMIVASTAAVQGSGGIAEEINGGTLEQIQMSPGSSQIRVLGRIAALAIEALSAAMVVGTLFVLGAGLEFHIDPVILIPALLTVADSLGYALLITALTVRVTSIGAITHVFNMIIMAFGGMMVPITVFPDGLETFARFIPTALGVQVLNATLEGEPLSATWSDGTLPWLLLHAAVLITVGLVLYAANIRRAQLEGGLSS